MKERLLTLQDIKYQSFSARLLPGVTNIIGVRLPELRKLAKEIARMDKSQAPQLTDDTFEEIGRAHV